jgi:hypothetical protein
MKYIFILIVLLFLSYLSFAFSFCVVSWNLAGLDPSQWGWLELRVALIFILSTAASKGR